MPSIQTYQQTTSVGGGFQGGQASAADFGGQTANALSRVSGGLQDVASAGQLQERINDQLLREQAEKDAKSWAGTTVSQASLDWTQNLSDRKAAALPGAPDFTPGVLNDFDKYSDNLLETAPTPNAKDFLKAHLTAMRTTLGENAITFQAGAQKSLRIDNAQTTIDNAGKTVLQDPSQYGVQMGLIRSTMPDVGPEVAQKLNDSAIKTLTNAAFASVLNADPYKAQDATSKAMGHDGFTGKTGVPWIDDADPAQVKTWNDAANTKVHMLEAEMARNAETKAKTAETMFGAATDLTFKGQFFSDAYKTQLRAATAGTQWQDATEELISSQQHTAGFASAPASDRNATIDLMRSRGATPGTGTDPASAKQLEKIATINSEIDKAVKDNPWSAAQQYGVIQSAPIAPITSPTDAIKVVQARQTQQGQIESWTGHAESPLQPQEAEQLAGVLAKLPPAQAGSLLGSLGASIGNADRVGALAKQLHDKDNDLGLAMSYVGTQTTAGNTVAGNILTGKQMIADGTVKVDGTKETGWKADIATKVRGSYANQSVENDVIRAAFLISAQNGGDTDTAIRQATGGGVIDFNGAKVPMPVGFAADGGQSGAEDRFHKAVASLPVDQLMGQITDGKVYSGGVEIAPSDFYKALPTSQFVMAGRSKTGGYNYAVKAGNSLVTNSSGAPILIQIK